MQNRVFQAADRVRPRFTVWGRVHWQHLDNCGEPSQAVRSGVLHRPFQKLHQEVFSGPASGNGSDAACAEQGSSSEACKTDADGTPAETISVTSLMLGCLL